MPAVQSLKVAFIPQPSCNPCCSTYAVFRMIPSFTDRHLREVEWAHPLNTSHIDSVLVRHRATLVEGIDSTLRAEVVLGFTCIELIKGQRFFALGDGNVVQVG